MEISDLHKPMDLITFKLHVISNKIMMLPKFYSLRIDVRKDSKKLEEVYYDYRVFIYDMAKLYNIANLYNIIVIYNTITNRLMCDLMPEFISLIINDSEHYNIGAQYYKIQLQKDRVREEMTRLNKLYRQIILYKNEYEYNIYERT